MPKEAIQKTHGDIAASVEQGWKAYLNSLEDSLNKLEKQITEAGKDKDYCTEDWCFATEHLLADLMHGLFSTHIPKTISDADERKLANLRKRAQDLYAQFKSVPGYAPPGI